MDWLTGLFKKNANAPIPNYGATAPRVANNMGNVENVRSVSAAAAPYVPANTAAAVVEFARFIASTKT